MISRYDRLMGQVWHPRYTEEELRRQTEELELLTEWHKAGIDVDSLYRADTSHVPSKAIESPRNGLEGPAKGID